MKTCPRCNLRYPSNATKCFVDGTDLVALTDPRIGLVLAGRYEIENVIAEGGMATVYLARHRVLNEDCAVKILNSSLARNTVVRERFRREAKATQKLAHPNIIEILDHGETKDGMPYLVMEYLRGETLADLIDEGPMSMTLALPIGLQIARALARAHDFDVIHRDLKPENVFLCKQKNAGPLAKLLDFGIARSMHDSRLTNAGDVFGTPQYMSPERISSIDAGPSADLYSLGIMLFEMLAGRLPFEADDVTTFFIKHINETAPTLLDLGIKIPPRLDLLIASLIAKTEDKRPVDAHAVCSELIEISNEQRVPFPAEPSTEPAAAISQAFPFAPTDLWEKRTRLFQQMMTEAYGEKPPADVECLLEDIQRGVSEISALRTETNELQGKISILEAKSREGRKQFGNAVEGLGIDASKAREEARAKRLEADELTRKGDVFKKRAQDCQAEIMLWEGRSAFEEPYPQLATAYRKAADTIDQWCESHRKDRLADERAKEFEGIVSDLEFQINELRSGLQRLEASSEKERESIEVRSTELEQKTDAVQQKLLELASLFCEPLRGNPKVAPLFSQLEYIAK